MYIVFFLQTPLFHQMSVVDLHDLKLLNFQMILQKCSHPLPTTPMARNTSGEATPDCLQSQVPSNWPRQLECQFQTPQLPPQRSNEDVNNKTSHDEVRLAFKVFILYFSSG
jgi:hypothetical protein